ncbi:lipopolysaccharide transport system ATP-binding protein [Pseudomonas asturiensis]|uniref:Lipopolysaccharide transport system ATP-binding protein n=1 Tax=Pseudomonas asturiensis TaxID=1190415 RepID=A0A1M7Q6U1_9PSED|nr:ABC transporter ATP-binding protein [Pseudomonas asturiensis]SHN26248.1 lipopolysaccharide transport system ATP-binding protein [Pseudomonas asturiensis]
MSSDEIAISVRDVSKCYYTYVRPVDRLLHSLVPRLQRRLGMPSQAYGQAFWALRNIDFEIRRGETVGIVGRNGSGKSTLLQIICGTMRPSGGSVQTQGRVAALLELGSGFNPEFTGRENVYLNASVLGLDREEVDQRFSAIAGFADIGDFIDQPVKHYSSGMVVRLAFAVQAQVDPQILIVDEALSVGDAKFQAKCFERLRQLKQNGASILLVTHASEQVVTHCNRAILLEGGRVEMSGDPRAVVNRYMDILFGRNRDTAQASIAVTGPPVAPSADPGTQGPVLSFVQDAFGSRPGFNRHEYRWGDGAASLMDFHLTAQGHAFPSTIEPGAEVVLHVAIRFNRLVSHPVLGFTLKTKEGVTVYGTNSWLLDCAAGRQFFAPGSQLKACLSFRNRLAAGDYFISLGVASREGEEIVPHDRRYDAIHFVVAATPALFGLVDLAVTMDFDQEQHHEPS